MAQPRIPGAPNVVIPPKSPELLEIERRAALEQAKKNLPGYWGTEAATLPAPAEKALEQTMEARKALDARSTTQNEGYSQAGGRENEVPADLAIELAERKARTPTSVEGYSIMGPRAGETKVDGVAPAARPAPAQAPQAQAAMEKVVAQNPEKAQDPDWLAKAWEGVVDFFGSPDAADDTTFWDILEGAAKGYAGSGPTSRQLRMEAAREDARRAEEAEIRARELETARGWEAQQADLERRTRLEAARIGAMGNAAGGFGGLNPEITALLGRLGMEEGPVIPQAPMVGAASPEGVNPLAGIDLSKIPAELMKNPAFSSILAALTGTTGPVGALVAPLAGGVGAGGYQMGQNLGRALGLGGDKK